MSIPAIRVFTVEHVKKVEALCCIRNQQEGETGSIEEISFQQFLLVMSHFRPPTLKTSEEEKETLRREKLRCKFPRAIPSGPSSYSVLSEKEQSSACKTLSSATERSSGEQLKRRSAPPVWTSVSWFNHTWAALQDLPLIQHTTQIYSSALKFIPQK